MPQSLNNGEFKFRRGFKKDADDLASKYRLELSLKDYDPLPAFKLAEHLQLKVICPKQLEGLAKNHLEHLLSEEGASSWSAVTLGIEKPSLIIYNSAHSPARIESDIMHEAAHVLLGHKMCEIDTSYGIPLRKYDETQEHEAEWLGACLQLPKPAMIRHYVFKSLTIEQIATMFNASIPMVNYRVGVSGAMSIKSRMRK